MQTMPVLNLVRPGLNGAPASAAAQELLQKLTGSYVLLTEDWERLADVARAELLHIADTKALLNRLVEYRLLTEYQVTRVRMGKMFGLVLGNYRILDRLGAGGMATIFKGEHVRLRRPAAIKVLTLDAGWPDDEMMLRRFQAEMRAVGELQHPGIVSTFDAGEVISPNSEEPPIRYFVMEYFPDPNLEERIDRQGPMPVPAACDVISQVAGALQAAHEHGLIHRDVKPANVIVTGEGTAKLLDFGLVHDFHHRVTERGIGLGTLDYVAPEQVQDAGNVDPRADIFGLGGTLFWCLTGRVPFPGTGNSVERLMRRLMQTPPSVRALRADLPDELDAVVAKMLDPNPSARYASAQDVKRALTPFCLFAGGTGNAGAATRAGESGRIAMSPERREEVRRNEYRVLVADDEANCRYVCRLALNTMGLSCDEAADGQAALEAVRARPYELLLLDITMPRMKGTEVLRELRTDPPAFPPKVILFSGQVSADDMALLLAQGADDFLAKPISLVQLQSRVQAALRLHEAQHRSEWLNSQLVAANAELDRHLNDRDRDLLLTRDALVMMAARLVASRTTKTVNHLHRMQRYCRLLAEEAAQLAGFAATIDPAYVALLERCVPLYDIGAVALPDHLLFKAGKLAEDERLMMQTHTTIGSDTIREVFQQYGLTVGFLQMASDIARHHHERYDGTGYPDRLAGDSIPLAARLVAICDAYEALRSKRPYRLGLAHDTAVHIMVSALDGHFDPALLQSFLRQAKEFARVYQHFPD